MEGRGICLAWQQERGGRSWQEAAAGDRRNVDDASGGAATIKRLDGGHHGGHPLRGCLPAPLPGHWL